jgi:hypothetical protein
MLELHRVGVLMLLQPVWQGYQQLHLYFNLENHSTATVHFTSLNFTVQTLLSLLTLLW